MEDVLALYEKPLSEKEPVVCIDEKPVVLHAEVRPPRPMRPGRIVRRDCEYQRRGTANAFCGVEPKAGRHFTKTTPNRSAPQFADYLVEMVAAYPQARTIHLVMDNLSSHRRKSLVKRYGEKVGGLLWDRFPVHYTPKHGSWLNQAEIEISLFSRECLGKRRIPSLGNLHQEARAWNRKMNRDRVTINWAQRVIRPAVQAIGLQWYGWHGFRRGIAYNLYALGANEKTVQRILRHAHPHVTKERYIKTFDPSVIEAMERLQATVEVLESVSSNWPAGADKAHAKLLIENRGEMAERLKAAVC